MEWPTQRDAAKFFGNPSNSNFISQNLIRFNPPFKMYYEGKEMMHGFAVNKKCAESLMIVFAALWKYYEENQTALDHAGVSDFAGCYNYRPIRGSSSVLSMHSFGAALDLSAARNAQTFNRSAGLFTSASPIVTMFKSQGWIWGGDWNGKRDPMHFQAARVR